MNKQGHLKASKNEPEPIKRTDLAHTIAHAAGVTHDCHVKPQEAKDSKKDKPVEKPNPDKEKPKPEVKPEEPTKPEEEALKSLKKILEDNELRKLVQAILEETEEERKKALRSIPDWAEPTRFGRQRSPEFFDIREPSNQRNNPFRRRDQKIR